MPKNQSGISHIIVAVVIVVAAIIGLAAWKVSDNNSKDSSKSVSHKAVNVRITKPDGPVITVTGKSDCLPHRDPNNGTQECALGLIGDNGKNYGLTDGTKDHSLVTQVSGHVKVTGILTDNQDSIYDSKGIIYITTVEKL